MPKVLENRIISTNKGTKQHDKATSADESMKKNKKLRKEFTCCGCRKNSFNCIIVLTHWCLLCYTAAPTGYTVVACCHVVDTQYFTRRDKTRVCKTLHTTLLTKLSQNSKLITKLSSSSKKKGKREKFNCKNSHVLFTINASTAMSREIEREREKSEEKTAPKEFRCEFFGRIENC